MNVCFSPRKQPQDSLIKTDSTTAAFGHFKKFWQSGELTLLTVILSPKADATMIYSVGVGNFFKWPGVDISNVRNCVIEPLLLSAVRLLTFHGQRQLTNATGFFFERDERLFLVTSRHVLSDEPSQHFPDRIEIELHIDSENVAESIGFSILLHWHGRSVWRQGTDKSGEIDVGVVEVDRTALPNNAVYRAFTPQHLVGSAHVEVGTPLLIVGFPLGFHDTLHHMPVVRQAAVASSFGLRFQGQGYFLTDARTHRGTSGAPVVMRIARPEPTHGALPWMLLGVHSARLDVGMRDLQLDEALGLNCAWYADILLTLTNSER